MLAAIVLIIVFAIGGTAWWCVYKRLPNKLIRPKRCPARSTSLRSRAHGGYQTPSDAGMEYESISVVARDGVNLAGWFIPSPEANNRTVILLHGVGSSRTGMLPTAKLLHTNGYNTLMYDSRASGESGGEFCTYGFLEKYDLVSVIDMLVYDILPAPKNAGEGHIGLLGFSMGAAVALQAAAIEPFIRCVIAESGFLDLNTVAYDYLERHVGVRWKCIHDTALRTAERIAHFSVKDVSPLESVKKLHAPVLFIHGTEDRTVKPVYSQKLYDACSSMKELYMIEGAHHIDLYETAGETYNTKRIEFFNRYL